MTRINAGIPPQILTSKHLCAEHREIKRIPNLVLKHGYDISTIPKRFTLGTGHVKFFYNKQKYLYLRYVEIYNECIARGFNMTWFGDAWQPLIETEHWQDYKPDDNCIQLIAQRINERLGLPDTGPRQWHYEDSTNR